MKIEFDPNEKKNQDVIWNYCKGKEQVFYSDILRDIFSDHKFTGKDKKEQFNEFISRLDTVFMVFTEKGWARKKQIANRNDFCYVIATSLENLELNDKMVGFRERRWKMILTPITVFSIMLNIVLGLRAITKCQPDYNVSSGGQTYQNKDTIQNNIQTMPNPHCSKPLYDSLKHDPRKDTAQPPKK